MTLIREADHGTPDTGADAQVTLTIDGVSVTVEGDDIATQVHVTREVLLEGAEDVVLGAGELRGDLVGQLHLPSCHLLQRFLHFG